MHEAVALKGLQFSTRSLEQSIAKSGIKYFNWELKNNVP